MCVCVNVLLINGLAVKSGECWPIRKNLFFQDVDSLASAIRKVSPSVTSWSCFYSVVSLNKRRRTALPSLKGRSLLRPCCEVLFHKALHKRHSDLLA